MLLLTSNMFLSLLYKSAATTVFWVLRNRASWTFSGIGCVLIKHIQYHGMSAGDSTEATVTMLLAPYE